LFLHFHVAQIIAARPVKYTLSPPGNDYVDFDWMVFNNGYIGGKSGVNEPLVIFPYSIMPSSNRNNI
jgi:hypothetical protein